LLGEPVGAVGLPLVKEESMVVPRDERLGYLEEAERLIENALHFSALEDAVASLLSKGMDEDQRSEIISEIERDLSGIAEKMRCYAVSWD
jgi:hypothetical protein